MDERIIYEIREEFQIPSFFEDEQLMNYVKEGKARLDTLNPGRDPDTDLIFRSLLKNYVYYAYQHRIDDWERNYQSLILSWQMGSEAI